MSWLYIAVITEIFQLLVAITEIYGDAAVGVINAVGFIHKIENIPNRNDIEWDKITPNWIR